MWPQAPKQEMAKTPAIVFERLENNSFCVLITTSAKSFLLCQYLVYLNDLFISSFLPQYKMKQFRKHWKVFKDS